MPCPLASAGGQGWDIANNHGTIKQKINEDAERRRNGAVTVGVGSQCKIQAGPQQGGRTSGVEWRDFFVRIKPKSKRKVFHDDMFLNL